MGRLISELNRRFNFRYLRFIFFQEARVIRAYVRSHSSLKAQTSFSIIMPCYGIELSYVKEAIASLKRQTYCKWELCVCDDGDPDIRVYKYLENLQKKNPEQMRIVRHEKNLGICAATRTALSLARNEFVVFMDADDLLHRRALEVVALKIAETDDYDFIYTNHDIMTDYGLRLTPLAKPGWSPELLLNVNYINHLTVARRETLHRCGPLFEDRFSGAQDWDLCLKMGFAARRVAHLPYFLYHWRARPGSIAHHSFAKPWAITAQSTVRTEFVEKYLSTTLTFDPMDCQVKFLGSARPLFRSIIIYEVRDETFAQPADVVDHTDHRDHTTLSIPAHSTLSSIAKFLLETMNDMEFGELSFVHFTVSGKPELRGELSTLGTYVTQPGVGGVWPFLNSQLRTGYTIGFGKSLVQVRAPRSSFSYSTGNILTGPWHGLTLCPNILKKALTSILDSAELKDLIIYDLNAVGAMIGLQLLKEKFRNVSIREVACDQELADISLPLELMPETDPYI